MKEFHGVIAEYKKAFVPKLEALQLDSIKRPLIATLVWWLCLPVAKASTELNITQELQEKHFFMKVHFWIDTESINFIIFILWNNWVAWLLNFAKQMPKAFLYIMLALLDETMDWS